MWIEAGQRWRFTRSSNWTGECEIVEVDGYGQITARFHDSIGTEITGRVERDELDYRVDE